MAGEGGNKTQRRVQRRRDRSTRKNDAIPADETLWIVLPERLIDLFRREGECLGA